MHQYKNNDFYSIIMTTVAKSTVAKILASCKRKLFAVKETVCR